MSDQIADITMHIDESTTHEDRGRLCDQLLSRDGVMAASYQDENPHLMVIAYDPDEMKSSISLRLPKNQGLHAELVGL